MSMDSDEITLWWAEFVLRKWEWDQAHPGG